MELTWEVVKYILLAVVIVNEAIALFTVFREKRDIAATWAWLLVLTFLPVLGFIIYAFLGRKLSHRKMDRIQTETQVEMSEALQAQKRRYSTMEPPKEDTMRVYRRTIMLFQNVADSFVSRHNRVNIYTDGNQLFRKMFDDIAAAKDSIHIEFYSIYNDRIGNELRTLLEQKAASGVEVRVLYDSWGSMGVKSSFYDHLRELGGQAAPFLMTRSNLFDFRLNYRDHRKIVTIDGQLAYIGGFNVGDQYLGRKAKFGPWRDTHLRIEGGAVYSLQQQFIRDWNASAANNKNRIYHYRPYFPEITVPDTEGHAALQVVASGPDSQSQQIKLGYLRLINAAQDHIWIQTPYLIPDDSVLDALRIAAKSGIDVRIMVPHMLDHPFVYRATQYYAHQLADDGVTIYFYQAGFMHAKTMVVDGKMGSVGSANMDVRSYKLNFEANVFIYDHDLIDRLERIFINDIRNSHVITPEMFAAMSPWLRFKQSASRLLSPIL
ncbi:cardiolipin synthase [Limosilactobacillus difficilis]|uniref:cardiolipin synthase n=1 Tax=Limosilactobacillus difficilis TaxID=2991838 RepID=UPI0024BA5018|nr:cardiolipin synthase [Limosilactobacillus difficilis]